MTASEFPPTGEPRIAVLIPCYNEEKSVRLVIDGFRAALPKAAIHVFDNRSSDRTAEVARAAGAHVSSVGFPGKGNVVRRAFGDVEADIYVLVDGDATYDASAAGALVQKLIDWKLDMVVGTRVAEQTEAYRPGHRFGNSLLTGFVGFIFGRTFSDMLSGYRIFSRRFVKSFPALSEGFEIETELTIHALQLRMPVAEVPTKYLARQEGSASKLRTYSDGWKILMTIVRLFRMERPLAFFSILGAIFAAASIVLIIPIIITYLQSGLVPRFPTAVLATGLMILAFLSGFCGLILDTVTRGRQEMKRLFYLNIKT